MNRPQAVELIAYTGQKWGAAAAIPDDPTLFDIRIQVWLDALSDISPADVRAVLSAAEDEFPPNVTVIRRRVEAARGYLPDLPAWDEFWAWVRAEASRSTLYLLAEPPPFVCLWPALAGLVRVEDVAQWARDGLEAHEFETILQAHLRRLFEARRQRVTAGAMSNVPAMALMGAGSAGQIGVGVLKRVDTE